jgi:hypothetical protein
MFDRSGRPRPGLHRALLRAVDVQRPLVLANLRRMRRQNPGFGPAQLSRRLERDYLAAVAGGGAAVGGTAAVPGVGTITSLGLSAVATVGFLEATAFYAASVAELHGIHLEDPDRARTTVMAIMLGEEGAALLSSLTGHALGPGAGPQAAWGAAINRSVSGPAARLIQRQIQDRFFKWVLRRQAGAMLGRALPFGVGAVVGGAGNLAMGRAVIRATRTAFGPAPSAFLETVPGEVVAAPSVAGLPAESPQQAVEREIEERRARLHGNGR